MSAALTGVRITQRLSVDGKSTYEEIEPLVPLAAKVTLGDGIDAAMLARAEAAVAELAAEYPKWASQDLLQMREAAAALRASPSAEQGHALYMLAHDMKGQGGSFGYPLISAIAGSLCRLLHRRAAFEARHLAAIEAHLDAAGAVLAQRLAGEQPRLRPPWPVGCRRWSRTSARRSSRLDFESKSQYHGSGQNEERPAPMYICLCNAISDRTVRAAVAAGCRSVSQVYQAIGERPQCGKCVSQVRALVRSGGVEDCPAYGVAAE